MASKFPEQDILVTGIVSSDTKSGTEWIQNLWTPNKTLEVRAGFGQVAQIDSTLSRFDNYNPALETDKNAQDVLGFQKVLGSYVMKTLEGHTQIISVFQTLGLSTSSENAVDNSGYSKSRRISCYEVVIYDIDTDQRWHEVLPTRTSNKNSGNRSPKFWHGGYETNSSKDWNDSLIGEGHTTVSFVELDGFLFFGSDDIPLFCYNPSTYRSQLTQPTRRKQVTIIDDNDSSYEPYGETCSIIRVSPSVNDALGQSFDWLDNHELPNPTSVTEFQGRLAVGRDKTVRFSDLNFLSAWKTLDFIQIPSFNDITCITGVGQFLYIFTKSETFLYRSPASGALLSGGEVIKVSDEIGCFGPLAHSRIQGIIIFADSNGIHSVNGSTIQTLSGPIKHMFQGGISSPLNNYTTQTGWLTYTNDQPRTFFDIRDNEEFVTLAYDELTTSLFCTIPRMNLTVVFKAATGFTFWNFEDIVTPDSTVNAKRNLPNPQVLALDGEIYLVGGIEDKLFNDASDAPATQTDVSDRSYIITRLHKGGAIDRSVKDEDFRTVLGYDYELKSWDPSIGSDMRLYITKPEFDQDGNLILGVYLNPLATLGHPQNMGSAGIDEIYFSFGYDTTHFEPVLAGASTTNLEILLPSERIPGKAGWSAFKSLDGATTVPNAAGTNICIKYDGSAVATQPWLTAPALNLIGNNRNPLCFIKIAPRQTLAQDTNSYGLFYDAGAAVGHVIQIVYSKGTIVEKTYDSGLIAWQQAVRTDLAGGYTWFSTQPTEITRSDYTFMSQSVNWVYKAPEVGNGVHQIRTRGIYSQIGSQGVAPQTDLWPWGQYNAGFAADRKEYSGQIIDNSAQANNTFALTTVAKKDPLRDRLYDSTAGIMDGRIFSGSARFGSDANAVDGNFLIDDSQYDTIAMSQSSRGEMVTVTMFGFMRNKAEALIIGGLKLVYKVVAGRRRRGR